MRVLIMHANDDKTTKNTAILQRALEKEGMSVDLVSGADGGGSPLNAARYSFVCVVSPFKGWWKPQIPGDVQNLLKKAMRLEGKKGVAFVLGKLGATKALRVLMGLMERQGVFVEDFGTLGGEQEMAAAARRLRRLG